jgi:hypothetical protein
VNGFLALARRSDGSPTRPRAFRWTFHTSCPTDWPLHLERCRGGFFHSPLGLLAGAPAGQPLFAQLVEDGRVVGVVAGVRHGCPFSVRPRHVYFPTLPALRIVGHEDAALAALTDELSRQNAVEVVFDSFDAAWQPETASGAEPGRQRAEHVVALRPSEEARLARCSQHHRRYAARGYSEEWSFDMLGGEEARALLAEVQGHAAERTDGRGDRVLAEPPAITALAVSRLTDPWGATVFGAWDGDTLLAAALVGWANRASYYICGGSTPAGHFRRASIWLHLRIMASLAAAGLASYNLGGTAASATEPGDKEHGLLRFKTEFGAEPGPCLGARWVLRTAHARAHQFVAGLMGTAATW